jgi:hypothetical protein
LKVAFKDELDNITMHEAPTVINAMQQIFKTVSISTQTLCFSFVAIIAVYSDKYTQHILYQKL